MALNCSTVKCIVSSLHPPAKGLEKRKDKAVQVADVKIFPILVFSLWTRGLLHVLILPKHVAFTGGFLKSVFLHKIRAWTRAWKWPWGNISSGCSPSSGVKQILLLGLQVRETSEIVLACTCEALWLC